MLELRRLALLHQFATYGTITAAAAAAGLSPSAVSQQLAVLEREVGAALLERSARSATLTDAGRRLAGHASRILDLVETAEADLAAPVISGRIVVCAVPTVATAWAPALVRLRREHGDLDVVLRQHNPIEALHALRAREVDVAVVDDWTPRSSTAEAGLIRRTLLRDPLVQVGDPAGGLWLCAPPHEPSRAATDRLLARVGVVDAVRWEFEGLATIARLVAQGTGAALLPRLALFGIDLPARELADHRRIEVVIREGSRDRPAVRAVLDALVQRGREI